MRGVSTYQNCKWDTEIYPCTGTRTPQFVTACHFSMILVYSNIPASFNTWASVFGSVSTTLLSFAYYDLSFPESSIEWAVIVWILDSYNYCFYMLTVYPPSPVRKERERIRKILSMEYHHEAHKFPLLWYTFSYVTASSISACVHCFHTQIPCYQHSGVWEKRKQRGDEGRGGKGEGRRGKGRGKGESYHQAHKYGTHKISLTSTYSFLEANSDEIYICCFCMLTFCYWQSEEGKWRSVLSFGTWT